MKWLILLNISLLVLCVFVHCDEAANDDDVEITSEEVIKSEPVIEDDIKYTSPKVTEKFYFAEHFDDLNQFKKKWIKSEATKDGIDADIAKYDGQWATELPSRVLLQNDLGLVLKSKAKHSAISAKLSKPFAFAKKPLVVQYEVTFQQALDCGGGYIKLLSHEKDNSKLEQFQDKTPYTIMFGPDKCGIDHKLHFIFRHKNPVNGSFEEKHCQKSKFRLEDTYSDLKPHLYTLIVHPDNSFEIRIDNEVINSGSLLEKFEPPVNPPAEIDDPEDKKPADWDEREKIPDPEATKPEDWDEDAPERIPDPMAVKPEGWLDDEPALVPDTSAEKPSDWDNDMDGDWEPPQINNPKCETAPGCGEWQPPLIPNPEFKGKWRAPLIENPNYKGKWSAKRIPNPYYFEDNEPFKMTTIGAVGFELWSMTPNILFDNIIITDDIDSAKQWAEQTFELKRKKLESNSKTKWGKAMKSMNYRPGWWALYFVYCMIPIVVYVWYLLRRRREESLWTRLLRYTHDNPWIWAIYVLLVGLPIILIAFFCCSSSNKDTEQLNAHKKRDDVFVDDVKKDTVQEEEPVEEETLDLADGDNDKPSQPTSNKSSLEEDIDKVEETNNVAEEASGDAPRRRRARKD